MGELNRRSPKSSCNNQLARWRLRSIASHFKGYQNQAATISWWQLRRAYLRSGAVLAVNRFKQFMPTITSTIQDQHVSNGQACDGEVIGCLNMRAEQAAGNTTEVD